MVVEKGLPTMTYWSATPSVIVKHATNTDAAANGSAHCEVEETSSGVLEWVSPKLSARCVEDSPGRFVFKDVSNSYNWRTEYDWIVINSY